jgi:hypothetical protein
MTVDVDTPPDTRKHQDPMLVEPPEAAAAPTTTVPVRTAKISQDKSLAAPKPRSHVALGELAQLYSQLKLRNDRGLLHAPLEDPQRAVFEEQLSVFEANMVTALRGAPSERPSWTTRLLRWMLRREPHDPMIKEYFFCSSLPAGVVLLCEPSSRLYLTFPPDARAPTWIAEQLVRAEGLYIEIREILRDPNRGICLEMVFAGIVQLIKLMGNEDYRQKQACPALPEMVHAVGLNGEVLGANGAAHAANGHALGVNGSAHAASGQALGANGEALAANGETIAPSGVAFATTGETLAPSGVAFAPGGVAAHSNARVPAVVEPPLHVPQGWHMPPWPELQKMYEAQLTQGADLVRRMAQRQAQLDYFWGMLFGALLLALVVAGVHFLPMAIQGAGPDWVANQLGMDRALFPLLWLCPVIGGVGAVVSVMQRMGTGNFALRDRAGAEALRRVGAFRPLIGAVFAGAVVTILFTGLVPLQLSAVGDQHPILLYCVVSFFAGFSERWAQDMLGAGEAAVSAGTDAERRAAAT